MANKAVTLLLSPAQLKAFLERFFPEIIKQYDSSMSGLNNVISSDNPT